MESATPLTQLIGLLSTAVNSMGQHTAVDYTIALPAQIQTKQLNLAGDIINPATEEKQDDLIAKDFATETTLLTKALESGGNLDTIASETTSIDGKVSTEAKQDVIVAQQTDGSQRTVIQTLGEDVGVQNPFQIDGDSIYVKDLNLARCDNGNFDGEVTDYFDSLSSVQADATANNPKIIKLWFNRTLYSHSLGIGCDDLAKGFGNSVTIKLLGSGESVRFTKTFAAADPNSFLAEFGPKAFNGVILEFNTASEVCVSNLTIAKSIETNSTLHGLDPLGNIQEVAVTTDGNLAISDNSNGLAIAKGEVTGSSFIHKFGATGAFNNNDGFVTVWDGAEDGELYEKMVYTYSTTADIDTLSSDDAGNTQLTEVQGLDANYDIVVQEKQLNGITLVTLDTPFIRVFRVKNVGSVDYAGHVFVSVNGTLTAGTPIPANVRAVVHGENNQTEMAVYTIPNGKTGYMRDWYASTAGAKKGSSHVVKLLARPFGQVFQLKHKASIIEDGTSYIKHDYNEPEVFGEKTDIEIRMNTDQDGAEAAAGFDIVLDDME